MILASDHEPKENAASRRDLKELMSRPGWTDHVLPFLQELEQEHTESAISLSLTPEKRAEHIQAIHAIRKIIAYPRDEILNLEITWKAQQRKPPTA